MKFVPAKRMMLFRVLHREDRGAGLAGAKAHSHLEEQIFIALKGTMRIRVADVWYTMGAGDVVVVPENVEHGEIVEGEFLWLIVKHRMPGHSQDDSWAPPVRKKTGTRREPSWTKWRRNTEKRPWGRVSGCSRQRFIPEIWVASRESGDWQNNACFQFLNKRYSK
jgi:mannose-6-phosphate isomerase-like protein (cupin superfamily)